MLTGETIPPKWKKKKQRGNCIFVTDMQVSYRLTITGNTVNICNAVFPFSFQGIIRENVSFEKKNKSPEKVSRDKTKNKSRKGFSV
jgi:hypothetical protein